MFTKSWTKTAGEIRRIEERLRAPVFADARWLSVQYLTRPEIVREVLPPPLEAAAEPLVTAGIGTLGRSNCVGAFDGGMLCVRARYKDVEADYCLAMPMSTDVAIIFGRELYGEPKKQARVEFNSDGDVVRASVSRFGVPYMALEARLTDKVPIDGPTHADRFHFKFMHAANGAGLEFDPILVHAHFTQHVRTHRRGAGKVIFRPSHHDPLAEIEVVELRGATYFEGDIHAEARRLATVEAARFMPYAFQNIDDYSAVE
jgi:acetoacetate decarboxylase